MSNQLHHVVAALASGPLVDVRLAGLVLTSGQRREFHPHYATVYLQIGSDALVRCAADEADGTLELAVVEEIAFDFEIPEGSITVVSSIAELCLRRPHSRRRVSSLVMVASDVEQARSAVARFAAFGIDGDDCLFLDPVSLSGMQIAGRAAYRGWLADYGRDPNSRYEVVWHYGTDTEIRPLDLDVLLEGNTGA